MVVGRYEMFKDTLGSDWKKNKIIGGAASELSKAAVPPSEVAPNIYGSGQPNGQVLSRNPAPSLSSPPPMLAQQPTPNPAIARMQNNAGATGLGAPAPSSTSSAASALASPPQRFKSTLPGGITYEGDKQGNRTYTMGSPGQDGYGRMTVGPGTGQRSAAANQLAAGVQRPDNGSGQQQPTAPKSSDDNTAELLQAARQQLASMPPPPKYKDPNAKEPQVPKYMTKEEGIAAGVGWKARAQIYAQQMDAYNKATGNQNALDVEQMREGGAGARAMLAAQGINDRNAIEREGQQSANEIARKRLTGELALNDTRIGTEQLGQQKGQMEIDAAKRMEAVQQAYISEQDPVKKQELGRQWQTLNLKSGDKYQMTTRKSVDPATGVVTETPYAFDPNSKETIEIGGGGNQDPAMAIIESNPSYKQAYQSADPKKQQEMLKALPERMAQRSK